MRRLFLIALALTILLPLLAVMLVFLAAAGESAAQCGALLAGSERAGRRRPGGGHPDLPGRGRAVRARRPRPVDPGGDQLRRVDVRTVERRGRPLGRELRRRDGPDAVPAEHVGSVQGAGARRSGAAERLRRGRRGVQRRELPEGLRRARRLAGRDLRLQPLERVRAAGPLAGAELLHARPHRPGIRHLDDNLGSAGSAIAGSPFSVPTASGDPAGPITLAPGQPTIVAATYFTDATGAWGDNLIVNHDSYAELSPGIPGSQVTRQNATMLGGLPYMTPLRVTNPQNGRSVILYKRDIGAGQPLSSTLDGYHYRIDLTAWADQQLGLPGSGIVQVTRLTGPVSTPGGGQACSASSGFAPAGSGIDPIPGFSIGRDDMGVDASAPVGTPIYAPLDSQLVEVVNNWYAGQPLLLFQFLQPPAGAPTAYWYVAEQVTPVTTTTGTIFRARQAVARFAPSGTGIEIGWGSPTSSGRTLAQQMGDSAAANPPAGATTTWGESFKRFFGIH